LGSPILQIRENSVAFELRPSILLSAMSTQACGASRMESSLFTCFLVDRDAQGTLQRGVSRQPLDRLPPGDVLIRVAWSSLNYKDALASQAHPGIVRSLPHVPGIDAAGTVIESRDTRYAPGQEVIVTGYELGAGQWGGWAEYIRVPASWVVPLPEGLSLREAMILGTAGFTAAQCVDALLRNGVCSSQGPIVVTGATGGVGSLSVKLLARLGFTVTAVTGKPALASRLKDWGATEVLDRSAVLDGSDKPLLSARWAGAVDTVGGFTLATLVRQTRPYGVVAACGLVGGTELHLTVHPFILRGVILAGIGSAMLPYDRRIEIWKKLSGPWKIPNLEDVVTTVTLEELKRAVERILRGEIVGRVLVDLQASPNESH
jgi:putative YhdH/YhfP family quinone oxidoreductase